MILGIGTDIVTIGRIEKACENRLFLEKYYTDAERKACGGKVTSLAGNFAAKEAVAKALGTGFSGFGPEKIEILRNEAGAPMASLCGGALERFQAMGGKRLLVTISHEKEGCAVACALVEGEEK